MALVLLRFRQRLGGWVVVPSTLPRSLTPPLLSSLHSKPRAPGRLPPTPISLPAAPHLIKPARKAAPSSSWRPATPWPEIRSPATAARSRLFPSARARAATPSGGDERGEHHQRGGAGQPHRLPQPLPVRDLLRVPRAPRRQYGSPPLLFLRSP